MQASAADGRSTETPSPAKAMTLSIPIPPLSQRSSSKVCVARHTGWCLPAVVSARSGRASTGRADVAQKNLKLMKGCRCPGVCPLQLIGTSPREQISATLKPGRFPSNKPMVAACGRDSGILAKVFRLFLKMRETVAIWHKGDGRPNYPNM